MKILLSSLNKTNTAHPSEWEGTTDNKETVRISYRCGEIKIFVDDNLKKTTEKDDLDIGGYMEDAELKEILIRDGLAQE